MATRVKAPATPSVLAWARESAGYTLAEVAARVKKTIQVVSSWEDEGADEMPTLRELEKLAIFYKRPLAIFFFPEPPDDPPATRKFRSLPGEEAFAPDTLVAVREAHGRQLALAELTGGKNPTERLLPRVLRPRANEAVPALAKRIREVLGLTQSVQEKWPSAEDAFKWCRDALESLGVFVFKRSFKQATVSGFCLTDDEFPVIYVNNSHVWERQLFTLFHELAHLLFHVDGVTTNDDKIDQRVVSDQHLEIKCNELAGETLVPEDLLKLAARGTGVGVEGVEQLAARFSVSREVILRRAVDSGMLPKADYGRRVRALGSGHTVVRSGKGSGGNYYRTQAAYLGQNYLRLAFSRRAAGLVTEAQLSEYTGVKASGLAKLENLVVDAK